MIVVNWAKESVCRRKKLSARPDMVLLIGY